MKAKSLALSAAAVFAVLTVSSAGLLPDPAAAQERQACLQNNRIWGWRVVNERTLIVNDRNYHPFLVHLSGGCIGLNDAILAIRLNTFTNLGCLGRGDRVSFRAPALGRMTCFVQTVEPYGPPRQDDSTARQQDRSDRYLDRNYYRPYR